MSYPEQKTLDSNTLVIRSAQNERLKLVRKLTGRSAGRQKLGLFTAEGEDLVAAADAAGWQAQDVLVAEESGLVGTPVEAELLKEVSELKSGTRAIGIYEQRWAQPTGPLCVYLHGVGDPGNVGTVIRSAAAFGASCVVCGPDTADPYSPKAVRASMGAIFTVPVAKAGPEQLPGVKVALVADAEEKLVGRPDQEVTLLIGAERSGLPDAVVSNCERVLSIPIAYESLNAAMAATVALYEVTRK